MRHNPVNLVVNVKIKKMDFTVFVCQDTKETFVIKVLIGNLLGTRPERAFCLIESVITF